MASAEIEEVLRYLDQHRPTERTLETVRAYLDAMVTMAPPAGDVKVEHVSVGGVPAERLTLPGSDASRTLVYLHGGGYCLGSAKAYRAFAARVGRAFGGVTIVPDYRLAPENPFPAGLHDCIAVTRALSKEHGGLGSVVLAGDSAGGGLALATLVSLRDEGHPLPAAVALLSPWVDIEGTGESMTTRAAQDPIVSRDGMTKFALMYLGETGDRKNPLAAPTYAKLEALPPLLVQVGTREVQLDDVAAFVEKARAVGTHVELEIWEEMLHVFQLFPRLPDAARAIDRVGAFLRAKVS